MKNKRKPYVPFSQQPYCCVPTCVQMVLYRRNIPLLSQDEIGKELGLIVPKRFTKILPTARTGRRTPAGWGCATWEPRYSLNRFFAKYKMGLQEDYLQLKDIDDVDRWLKEQLKHDNDVVACFNAHQLFGTGKKFQGHVCVIDSIKDDMVTLIDPGRLAPKYRQVKLKKLIKAIEYHINHGCRGGFWVISKA